MKRIAIIGHPTTAYSAIENMLHRSGVSLAATSRREGFTVHQIHQTLINTIHSPGSEVSKKTAGQIKPSEVWAALVLDLLLANDENALWCWADPQALPLLQFWHEVDENTLFLLLYQEPELVLQGDTPPQSQQEISETLDEWVEYNRSLLAFYQKHPRRSLLIHADALLNRPEYLNNTFSLNLDVQRPGDEASENQSSQPSDSQQLTIELRADNVRILLQKQLVDYHPARDLYTLLQSTGSLPSDADCPANAMPNNAWGSYLVQQQSANKLMNTLSELAAVNDEHEELLLQHTDNLRKLSQSDSQRENLEHENGLLLKQMHELQEEVERLSQIEKESSKNSTNTHIGATDEENKATLNELMEENALLLEQLHMVQEEFERLYLQKMEAPKKLSTPHYGAGDRIKRQLTYRLGATLVHSRSISDYLRLPVSLIKTYRQYKKEIKASAGEKLPPISSYADAHMADQVKNHLSYRLGKVLMQHATSPIGWVKMPFAMKREYKAFRQQRSGR